MSNSWLPTLFGDRKGEMDPFRSIRAHMDEMFPEWSGGMERLGVSGGIMTLRMDVSESPTELTVKADLPGVEQKDIDVTVSGDHLSIKAERRSEAEERKDEKGRVFHRVERAYGSYQRSMRLPFEVDPAKVQAAFKDGVLTLTLPKPPEVQKQTRKIEVKTAG